MRMYGCKPFALLVVAIQFTGLTMALAIQGMEENCILSFVVPRDKMKSSCELDEKVNRRINAMEMKVNIYKQQVAELQLQLDKQRQLNSDKFERLEQDVKDNSVNSDMGFLIERRLALLEKEFEQLHSEVAATKATASSNARLGPDDNKVPFNALDNTPVTSQNRVRSMVQSEVKNVFDNFTNRFESYVREQILVYNQVFNMLPKNSFGRSSSQSPGNPSSKENPRLPSKDRTSVSDGGLHEEFERVKSNLDDTGDKIAKHVGKYIKNLSRDKQVNFTQTESTVSRTTTSYEELPLVNSSELVLSDDLSESNDSFSGENPEGNDTSSEATFTTVDKNIFGRVAQKDFDHNTTDSRAEKESGETNWKENMIRDQNHKQAQVEKRLKDEITSMLYSPLAEVMSLVEKQTAALEDKLKLQAERNQQANKDLSSHVKELDNSVQAIKLQLESVSQGLQDGFTKLDKIKPLEMLVNEIKKNISSEPQTMSVLEMDEQSKKLKKLERLMGVYQQSLEHYRNETKHEYREIRDSLERETTMLKKMSKSLQENITSSISSSIHRLNNTYRDRLEEMDEQIRIHEDNVLLMQIDLSTFERKLNSKSTRSDRDLEDIQDTVKSLAGRHRDLRKKLENIEQLQSALTENINGTAKDVFDLKTEVKLSVLDEWLPLTFEYDSSRTECYGDQYVKRTKYSSARLVGVVLCSPTRYKIFLSTSLESTFLNIGDVSGMGEDHCEFVGGSNDSKDISLSPFKPTYGAVKGFARSQWGQEPSSSFLNAIKPSPNWYECGVSIP